jgi:uroporphyrinogen-III synthase
MVKGRTNAKPLQGTRILVTRARRQASGLSALLRQQGAKVAEIPCIEIRRPKSWKPLDHALRNVATYDWLILTSVNGVQSLTKRLKVLKISRAALKHLRIAAIGPVTRSAITDEGLRVECTPKEYVAEAVVQSLRRNVKGKRVLIVRAAVARDVIPRELRRAGAQVDVVPAYETGIPARARAKLRVLLSRVTRRPHVITFTSSSAVRNFTHLLGRQAHGDWLQHVALASLGPVTSATLRELKFRVAVQARSYTMPGLAAAITDWSRQRKPRL